MAKTKGTNKNGKYGEKQLHETIRLDDGRFSSTSRPYEIFSSMKELHESQKIQCSIADYIQKLNPATAESIDGNIVSGQHPYELSSDLEALDHDILEPVNFKRQSTSIIDDREA